MDQADMHVSVERLRVGLLVGAVLLLGVIASFLGYAHLRAHRFLKDLPGKMGAELRQETNGYTYSQTVQGRTVFTIHAAKALQRTDGKVTLHDVGIVLYGRTQAGVTKAAAANGAARQDLADRIYGKEFEYDQSAGVVRAMGEVHIDLEAPIPLDPRAKTDFLAGREARHDETMAPKDDRVIHVKTSSLVFLQKLGVASTESGIEFEFRGLKGQATGADYNSDSGILILHSDVVVTGLREDRPAVLRAAHAELNRVTNQVKLTQARYVSAPAGTAKEETASAEDVVFYGVDVQGSAAPERVEARGAVVLTDGSATITGATGEMLLDARNQPQRARLSGGVGFRVDDPARAVAGTAAEGSGQFDGTGRLERVHLAGDVKAHEIGKTAAGEESQQDLSAARVDLSLATAPGGRQWLREAVADGSARLVMVSDGAGTARGKGEVTSGRPGSGRVTSELRGDHLQAQLALVNGTGQLTRVQGAGHTSVRRVNLKGEDLSVGNSLDASFGPAGAAGGAREQIVNAVQAGDVQLTQTGADAVPEHATADRATYDAGADRVTLTGGVRLADASGVLLADRVSMVQTTGDATATGSVRASYLQAATGGEGEQGAHDPVHVLADHAELEHATQKATFYGSSGGSPGGSSGGPSGGAFGGPAGAGAAAGTKGGRPLARLWQAGSQIEAPVIEVNREERSLQAHGAGTGSKGAVRTVWTSGQGEAGQVAASGKAPKGDVLRVTSRDLVYSDAARRADFSGGVVMEDAQGSMRSERAEVYLEAALPAGAAKNAGRPGAKGFGVKGAGTPQPGTGPLLGGSVERIVASGDVALEQPGRQGHGEQVVYTASDGVFVMTGTAAAPPRIVDEVNGTVVGQSLRFNTGDNSVVVSGDASRTAGHRVRTDTRVRQTR